ncbi:hypothetical protein MERGE_000501 [Pneumocystis wakefieldiae]|uniref:Translation initiation factor IF2/IF5 domain-containing protein n=1 Tax=Pneumocystis wakefieldiae TaxID=38082 RepID=A0A899FZZ2_9ASCO|nr:hypothetical protein MERGE_000501 [Pneumocystis wakefieldiae]
MPDFRRSKADGLRLKKRLDIGELEKLEMAETQKEMDRMDHSLVEEFGFDTFKKKKKSKKVSFDSDNESLDQDGEASGDNIRLGSDADADVDEMTSMFASLKKKKKQAVSAGQGDQDDLKELDEMDGNDPLYESFDLGEGTKKKKKMSVDALDVALNDSNAKEGSEAFTGLFNAGEQDSQECLKTERDYTYAELLAQIFKILRQNNPELAGEKKRMHRNSEHVIQFLFAELGTSGSVDGSSRLVIKGKFQQKQIENVLKRYIVEYVTCKICKSPDTLLTKENRIYFMTCESCGSKRSVITFINTCLELSILGCSIWILRMIIFKVIILL